jgi:hypothetical protein
MDLSVWEISEKDWPADGDLIVFWPELDIIRKIIP